MSAVLGISGTYHDSAAALVVDGVVVAAVQEERLSRIKNDPRLPARAAKAVLAYAGMVAGDLDRVVYYEEPFDKLERVLVSTLKTFPRSLRQFPKAIGAQLGQKIWVLDQIAEMVGVDREKVSSVSHHQAHAASAFYVSGYDKAAVLTVDGVGEATTTAMWSGDGNELAEVGRLEFPHSLGLVYAGLTAYLGFEVNEGEYKVMGLAAYGQPKYRDEFARLVKMERDGFLEVDTSYLAHLADSELGFGPKLEELLGPRRATAREWDVAGEDRRYADIAATLQAVTEECLVALAVEARRRTGATNLCLAGGVALNCVANRRLAREAGYERVFVQPAAGDAGGALGAAVLGALELGDPRPAKMTSAALGLEVDVGAAQALAVELGLKVRRVDDPAAEAAAMISRGEIVGVCQGRFEWGPRALGNRSILANPRDPDSRERLNRAIKRREPFRPFAPAVLAEVAGGFFRGAPDDMTPFMTTVCDVVDPDRLASVTHVDGTARVQTVAADGALAAVLRALPEPIVLNTSFNGPGEPIVASEVDALAFLIGHPIEAVVIGDLVVSK